MVVVTSYNMRTNREVIGVPAFEEILKECDANNDRQLDKAETETNLSVLSRPDADGEGDHPLRIFFRMLDENRDGMISETEWPRMQGWVDTFEHANGFLALRLGESSQAPELFWKQEDAVPECPTPVCQDGILFAVRNGGVLTCLATASGEVTFQDRLLPGGPYYSSPVLGDGKIWFASARGEVSVITATGTPKLLSSVDLKEPVWATPALANGTVFVRSKNSLWAFGKKPNE
jgi:outer membrane protein assembly factor BamB